MIPNMVELYGGCQDGLLIEEPPEGVVMYVTEKEDGSRLYWIYKKDEEGRYTYSGFKKYLPRGVSFDIATKDTSLRDALIVTGILFGGILLASLILG